MARPKETIFKVVISDPKTGKSIQIETKEISLFIGKKIGDKVNLDALGLNGYEVEITGGSDFSGAPMVEYIEGTGKKYVWWWVNRRTRIKKLVRGNTISEEIVQINTKITKYGEKSFEEIYEEWKKNKKKEE